MKKSTKQPPSLILQDNEGHWYIIPENKVVAFESALAIFHKADDYEGEAYDRTYQQVGRFQNYRIDGPHRLRLLAWEEMT